jgi:hypothetical protein
MPKGIWNGNVYWLLCLFASYYVNFAYTISRVVVCLFVTIKVE